MTEEIERAAKVIKILIIPCLIVTLVLAAVVANEEHKVNNLVYCPYRLEEVEVTYEIHEDKVDILSRAESHWQIYGEGYTILKTFPAIEVPILLGHNHELMTKMLDVVKRIRRKEAKAANDYYLQVNGTCTSKFVPPVAIFVSDLKTNEMKVLLEADLVCILDRDDHESCLSRDYYQYHSNLAESLQGWKIFFRDLTICLVIFSLCFNCCCHRQSMGRKNEVDDVL